MSAESDRERQRRRAATAPAGGGREAVAEALARASSLLEANLLEEAERALSEGLDAAERLRDDAFVATIQLRMGEVRLRKGDHGAAQASAVAALEIFGRLGSVLDRARACRVLGSILRESGAPDLAEPRLVEAAGIALREDASRVELDALVELALLYRGDARVGEALRCLGRLLELIRAGVDVPTGSPEEDRRWSTLSDLFGDTGCDIVPPGVATDADSARSAARVADILATELQLNTSERLEVVFAASIDAAVRDAVEANGVDPCGAEPPDAAGRVPGELLAALPADTTAALGLSAPDATSSRSLPRRLVRLASRLGRAIRNGEAGGAPVEERVRAALTSEEPLLDGELAAAVRNVEWNAVFGHQRPTTDASSVPAPPPIPAGTTTILVVDDDANVRTILSDYFAAKGYRVETVETGDGLFSILGRVKPDLLLLDLMLPGRDGRTILDRIRASLSWGHVPVIVITAIREASEATRTLRAGADDWVEKPLDLPTLHARVERLLALRRALHETEKHRARQELLLEIIRELTGSIDTDHLLNHLVRRVAEATGVARCSLVLTDPAESRGTLASAYDNPTVHGLQLDLERYPEIRRALETREPVIIGDLYQDPLFDDVRRKWATSLNVRSSAVIPLLVDDSPIGVFFIRTTLDEPPLDPSTVEFATQVTEAAGKALEYARLFERISSDLKQAELEVDNYRSLSLTDPLTGLANRAGLESIGSDLFASARAFDHPLAVVMLDLDNFKELNDTYSHAAGDEVLRGLGAALSEFADAQDLVARYGGDEFCLVLSYREVDDATRIARMIGERIQSIGLERTAGETVRASIGVAAFPLVGARSLNELIAHADEALYRAKSAGGGHVQVAFGGQIGKAPGSGPPNSTPA